jgi:hypothetical protein
LAIYLFRITVRIPNEDPSSTHKASASLINVNSCTALLRMLPVCIRSYLKSVLKYKFLILDTYYPDTIYMSKDGTIRGYFSKSKKVHEQKSLWSHGVDCLKHVTVPGVT